MKAACRIASVISLLVLTGCASYYGRDYAGSGIYYGSSVAHVSGYRGAHAYGYGHSAIPLNPVIYPYWSLDHFYFSSFHHPYSVVVGYHQPLYYPYPGWIYGYHRPHRVGHASARGFSASFGYPWPTAARYPHYSHGFFISSTFGHSADRHRYSSNDRVHRLREIDHRLAALSRPAEPVDRRALLSNRSAAPASRSHAPPGRIVQRRAAAPGGRDVRGGQPSSRDFPARRAPLGGDTAPEIRSRSEIIQRERQGRNVRQADPAALRGRLQVTGEAAGRTNPRQVRRPAVSPPDVSGGVPEASLQQSSSPAIRSVPRGNAPPVARQPDFRHPPSGQSQPIRDRRRGGQAVPAAPGFRQAPDIESRPQDRGRPAGADHSAGRDSRQAAPSQSPRRGSSGARHRTSGDGSARARILRRDRGGNRN